MKIDTILLTRLRSIKEILMYKINNIYYLIQDYYSGINEDTRKIERGIFKLNKREGYNLSNFQEKQLSRVNGFYDVLMNIEDDKVKILFESTYYDKIQGFLWSGMEDMGDFQIFHDEDGFYDKKSGKLCIRASYSEYQYGEHIQGLERGDKNDRYECYTKEEFNLLMQIYYGVYDDEKLKKELEEREKKGEFEGIELLIDKEKFIKENQERIEEYNKKLTEEMDKKQHWDYSRYTDIDKEFNKIILSKPKVQDYLKLQLLRKTTHGAFQELEIKKIYDKNWDEKEQKKVVEEINKELGKDDVVIVEEE